MWYWIAILTLRLGNFLGKVRKNETGNPQHWKIQAHMNVLLIQNRRKSTTSFVVFKIATILHLYLDKKL
jgi:hypothetical protein